MADVYLCGNDSDNPGDVKLRGANPCSATTPGGGEPLIRYQPSRPQPPTGRGTLRYRLDLYGSATVSSTGRLDLAVATAATAAVAAAGSHTIEVAATGTPDAVTATGSIELRTGLTQLHDEHDDLLVLFDVPS